MGSAADDLSPSQPTRSAPAVWPPVRASSPAREPERAPQRGLEPPLQRAAPPRPAPSPARASPQSIAAPTPSTERRYRQTINHVDLWSVLKVSVCFYICSMAVVMVALVALWVIGDAAGVIQSVEKFLGDLLQTKDFTFLDGAILRGALLISAVIVVLLIVITVIAAAFYNLFAEIFGGIEISITEDESAL